MGSCQEVISLLTDFLISFGQTDMWGCVFMDAYLRGFRFRLLYSST